MNGGGWDRENCVAVTKKKLLKIKLTENRRQWAVLIHRMGCVRFPKKVEECIIKSGRRKNKTME